MLLTIYSGVCCSVQGVWEELAVTPYRVEDVNSGHKMGCSAWRRTLCLSSVSDSVTCLLNYFGLISKLCTLISPFVSRGWKLWCSVLSFCSLGRAVTVWKPIPAKQQCLELPYYYLSIIYWKPVEHLWPMDQHCRPANWERVHLIACFSAGTMKYALARLLW